MADSNSGIAGKILETGGSLAKSVTNEIKTVSQETIAQVTGESIKSDQELQQIAAHDKQQSNQRIGEIQQELAEQRMRRFQEVSSLSTATPPQREESPLSQPQTEAKGPHIPRSLSQKPMAESVRQAVGKSEQGRNFKG